MITCSLIVVIDFNTLKEKKLFDDVIEYQEKEGHLKESIAKGITGRGNKSKQINDALNQNKRQFI